MRTSLTPFMLDFLIEQGYNFLLSKTENINAGACKVLITLTPVKTRPAVQTLPEGHDTYFDIRKEPAEMAKGVIGTIFLVHLTQIDISKLKELVINGHPDIIKHIQHLSVTQDPSDDLKAM